MRAAGCGSGAGVSVSGFVEAFDQVTSLLKFNGKKERCGNIDSLNLDALLIITTGRYLLRPKSETIRIGFAIQKVKIVLAHKKGRYIAGIRARRTVVIDDGHVRG